MKISASEQVQRWLVALPPDTKKRVRRELRGLQNGRGDIKALRGELEGFCRSSIPNTAGISSDWNMQIAAIWCTKRSSKYCTIEKPKIPERICGEHFLAETIELVKIKTRQFAKRQMTWFRRHGNCEWVESKPEDSSELIIKRALQFWNQP
jgi:hypothetical protein